MVARPSVLALAALVAMGAVACKKKKPPVPLSEYTASELAVSYGGPALAKTEGAVSWPPLADVGALIGPALAQLAAGGEARERAVAETLPALIADHPLVAYSTAASLAGADHDEPNGRLTVSCGHAEIGELSDGEPAPAPDVEWPQAAHRLAVSFRQPPSLVAKKTLKRGIYLGSDHAPHTPLALSIEVDAKTAEALRRAHREPGSLECHHLIALTGVGRIQRTSGDPLAYLKARRVALRLVSTARAEILYDSMAE